MGEKPADGFDAAAESCLGCESRAGLSEQRHCADRPEYDGWFLSERRAVIRVKSHQLLRQMLLQPRICHLALPFWSVGVIQECLSSTTSRIVFDRLLGRSGSVPSVQEMINSKSGRSETVAMRASGEKLRITTNLKCALQSIIPLTPLVHVTRPCSACAIEQQRTLDRDLAVPACHNLATLGSRCSAFERSLPASRTPIAAQPRAGYGDRHRTGLPPGIRPTHVYA